MKVYCRFCSADFHTPNKKYVECPSCGASNEKNFVFTEKEETVVPDSQMMYQVSYDFRFYGPESKPIKTKHEQISQKTLDYIKKNEKGHYENLVIEKELGMTNTTWLKTWYEIGLRNHWIASAYDPEFKITSFFECKTLEHLLKKLGQGNWSLGTAFYYKNLAFINQVNGGDEWLIIKENIDFESYSCGCVIRENEYEFVSDIYRYLHTPTSEIRNFEYKVDIPEEIEIDGIIYRDKMKIKKERIEFIFKAVTDQQLSYLYDSIDRMNEIKKNPEQYIRYLESKGYSIDMDNLVGTKNYRKEELPISLKSDGTLDKSSFAWRIEDYKVKDDVVEISVPLQELITNLVLESTWKYA